MTLFKAGTSSKAISDGISHVFVLENLQDIVVTNIVYNARLGRPVAANNERILRAFKKLGIDPVFLCMPIEECMFVHCLKQLFEGGVPEGRVYGRRFVFVSVRTIKRHHHHSATLQNLGSEGMHDASVRVNICRTGVVNFFVGLPGGLLLSSNPEQRVVSVCETL